MYRNTEIESKETNKSKVQLILISDKMSPFTFDYFTIKKLLINLGNVKRNAVRAGKNKAASPRPM
jgi:hypothetical protein